MTFEEALDQAFGETQPFCPNCATPIILVPGEAPSCNCGWTTPLAPPDKPDLQMGQRYSELARMIPKQNVLGVNAGRYGDRG